MRAWIERGLGLDASCQVSTPISASRISLTIASAEQGHRLRRAVVVIGLSHQDPIDTRAAYPQLPGNLRCAEALLAQPADLVRLYARLAAFVQTRLASWPHLVPSRLPLPSQPAPRRRPRSRRCRITGGRCMFMIADIPLAAVGTALRIEAVPMQTALALG